MITKLGIWWPVSLLLIGIILSGQQCSVPNTQLQPAPKFAEKPRNIIFLVGDGLGLSQFSAGLYDNDNQFPLERFPVIGLHKTHSYSDLITDSGASATAMACGEKTFNFAIGINKDTLPCQSILEEAEQKGMATGLIASSKIQHATPAAFIAHQPNRLLYEKIALDFLHTEIDLFIGGGKKYFDRRSDDRNLLKELEERGYRIYDYFNHDIHHFSKFEADQNVGFLTADNKPLSALNGRTYLSHAAKLAMDFLDKRSEEGFFLMLESSQIDWSCHAGDPTGFFAEFKDFNKILETVLAFAEADGETLVIVTGDHETGGMSLVEGSKMKRVKLAFTTNGHTATMIPVYAYGPKSELFRGIYENSDIHHKMRQALGWSPKETANHTGLPASK